jgi:hypothetical protein
MALQFKPINTIKKIIEVKVPGDHGKTTKADFEATFRRLGLAEAKDLIKKSQEGLISDEDILRQNVIDFKGVKDSEGKDVEFSLDLLNQMIDEAYIRAPLIAGFMDINFNLEKFRTKN